MSTQWTEALVGRTPALVGIAGVSGRIRGLARATRPKQWAKNAACLAGLVFSGRLFRWDAVAHAGLAFLGFSLAASGIYLVNDVLDRELDRQNPKKRGRPIASGVVPVGWALVAASALLVAAVASSFPLKPICWFILLAYIGQGFVYSFRLKHRVLLDVMIIATGFVLRVLYGVYAISVKPTPWIILCMFFLALFLGFAKRRSELCQAGDDGDHQRPVLRKYDVHFLDILLAMTATMAIVCYALYTVSGRPDNATLVFTVPLVAYGIIRYLLRVMVHGIGDEPENDIFMDRVSIALIVAWATSCAAILYTDFNLL